MKQLERYVKKSGGKAHPYGGTETKGSWKGSKGPQMDDQYAEEDGKPVVEDSKDYDESEAGGDKGIMSIKSGGKKKQRSYLKGM